MKYTPLFVTQAGSHLYGTAIPGVSDMDYRGVVFEPVESLVGLNPFEQYIAPDEVDSTYYGLRKFVKLAAACNPNIIELLFAPTTGPTCVSVIPEWFDIVDNSDLFLGKDAITNNFIGYATSQFQKMRAHREWLTKPAPVKPDFQDYEGVLVDGSIVWGSHGLKLQYDAAKKHWENYQTWLNERNRARFALEYQFGYDTKNAMHLVRLINEGIELLSTGQLVFPRPEAKRLLEIRNGAFTYEQVEIFFEEGKNILRNVSENSGVPEKANLKELNKIVQKLNFKYLDLDLREDENGY